MLAKKLPIAGIAVVINIGSNDAAASTTKENFKTRFLGLKERINAAIGAVEQVPIIIAQIVFSGQVTM